MLPNRAVEPNAPEPQVLAHQELRTVPDVLAVADLTEASLAEHTVALPFANTSAREAFRSRHFGQFRNKNGHIRLFNPQCVLVKFRNHRTVSAVRVPENEESRAVEILKARNDVEFAELDVFQQRQLIPNDTQVSNQWHHAMIGSFQAWDTAALASPIRLAIVDTPFQMDHPDLAPNTVPGWDVELNEPVTSSAGIDHSTMSAGIAAAVINNGIGVAGAANCRILPINVNGATSEIYDAIIWAADHGVRVVSVSWTGADSSTLNDAGLYLKTTARGILVMAGVNGTGWLDYPNHPYIQCISMTDAADNMRSRPGAHIDFAAPGYDILSTGTGSTYVAGSGTSYSTPLFAGIAAFLLSINPTLGPDEIIGILETTAVDKGEHGWDPYFGWGRVNFGAAAAATVATLPRLSSPVFTTNGLMVTTQIPTNVTYGLWKKPDFSSPWLCVSNAVFQTNGGLQIFDPTPSPARGFYRLSLY